MTLWLTRTFLRLTGWTAEGTPPATRSYVLIAAPHTSNWDLAFLLAFARVFGLRPSFMAKHTLFRGPMGWFMRRVGGLPVRRDRRSDLVRQMVELFESGEDLVLAVPPEGTRGASPYWKSGFYQIARAAGVPVVMSYLDYASRSGGFGPELLTSGDVQADMDEIRSFYRDKRGLYPENFGQIRLKEELEPLQGA